MRLLAILSHMPREKAARGRVIACLLMGVPLAISSSGCFIDMRHQAKVHKPLQESDFFADGSSARPFMPGTVARGSTDEDIYYPPGVTNPVFSSSGLAHFTSSGELTEKTPAPSEAMKSPMGMSNQYATPSGPFVVFRAKNTINTNLTTRFPFPVTRDVLQRGQERFNIYCTPCHGRIGDGKGMIVQRGFALPPSYHIDRLRSAPVGHFFDVITNGYGAMYSYSDRITPKDRWAIVAYIRALQLSQHVKQGNVPAAEWSKIQQEAK